MTRHVRHLVYIKATALGGRSVDAAAPTGHRPSILLRGGGAKHFFAARTDNLFRRSMSRARLRGGDDQLDHRSGWERRFRAFLPPSHAQQTGGIGTNLNLPLNDGPVFVLDVPK